MAWFQSELHPLALYLDPDVWQRELRLPPCYEAAQQRAILPQGVPPPPEWQHLRETRILRLNGLEVADLLPEAKGDFIEPGGPLWTDWIAAHWRVYQAEHRDNPPRALSPQEQGALFGESLVAGFGLWEAGQCRGFASLRSGGEVGWMHGASEAILKALLAAVCTCDAAPRVLELEVDSTQPLLWEVAQGLPTLGTEVFHTYVSANGQ